eukprot:Platyproteum_vivax@DN10972_c0_g1_i1.p1
MAFITAEPLCSGQTPNRSFLHRASIWTLMPMSNRRASGAVKERSFNLGSSEEAGATIKQVGVGSQKADVSVSQLYHWEHTIRTKSDTCSPNECFKLLSSKLIIRNKNWTVLIA